MKSPHAWKNICRRSKLSAPVNKYPTGLPKNSHSIPPGWIPADRTFSFLPPRLLTQYFIYGLFTLF